MNEGCPVFRTAFLYCVLQQKCHVENFILPRIVLKWELSPVLDVFQVSATEQLGVNKSVINMLLKSSLKTQKLQHIFLP